MKVSELSGGELDRFVFKARGMGNHYQIAFGGKLQIWDGVWQENYKNGVWVDYCPSSDWEQGGELIEEKRILIVPHTLNNWQAQMGQFGAMMHGVTPLEAAMRVLVFSVFGEEVEE